MFLAWEIGLNGVSLQRINNSAGFFFMPSPPTDAPFHAAGGGHFLSAPINNRRSAPNRLGREEAGAQHVGLHQNFRWLQYVLGPNGVETLAGEDSLLA